MMPRSNSLILNGHKFSPTKLWALCQEKLNTTASPRWEKELYSFILDWISGSDEVFVHTSGSTGTPKSILQPKERMINSALMTQHYFGLNKGMNALMCLPASYIAGKMMVVRSFVTGMNLIAVEPAADPFQSVEEMINFAAVTPYQLMNSLETLKGIHIDSLIVGGGEIPAEVEQQCQGISSGIFATYGMTETSSHIALRRVNGKDRSPWYEVLSGVGIETNEQNCLIIKAPALHPRPLITNDVVILKDSTHFEWIGRLDHVINSGGVKIQSEQVEKKLVHLFTRRFFIAGLPDRLLGERVTLFIEGDVFDPIEYQSFKAGMSALLARFERPREIVYIPSFDLSGTGKILKKIIVSKYLKGKKDLSPDL